MPELALLFGGRPDKVREIIGQFISIYDGKMRRASGVSIGQEINSRFSMIGCIASAGFEEHREYMNKIGSRFLIYRIPAATRAQRIDGARKQNRNPAVKTATKNELLNSSRNK